MITKERKMNRYCCLYVSEYHLEMILLPYIRKNMDRTNIIILSENNLEDSVKVVLDKINFEPIYKEKILNLGWNNNSVKEINYDNAIIIINGKKEYINTINEYILSVGIDNKRIIECIDINEVDVRTLNISDEYEGILNTSNG